MSLKELQVAPDERFIRFVDSDAPPRRPERRFVAHWDDNLTLWFVRDLQKLTRGIPEKWQGTPAEADWLNAHVGRLDKPIELDEQTRARHPEWYQ